MNLEQFTTWALGQGQVPKFNDGQFSGQCVSLINQYCYRVLGVPAGSWGDAATWANDWNVNRQFFHKVPNPQPGDIGIMGSNYGGGYGHIFIYLNPSMILEQNGRRPLKVSEGAAYPNPIAILRPNKEEQEMKPSPKDVGDVYKGLTGNDISQKELDQYISLDNGILALVKNLIPGVQKARDSVKLLENERDTVLYPAFDELKKLKTTDPVKKLDQIKQIVN